MQSPDMYWPFYKFASLNARNGILLQKWALLSDLGATFLKCVSDVARGG